MSGVKRLLTPGSPFKVSLVRSVSVVVFGLFIGLYVCLLPANKVSAAGAISGTVYIDYNMNGVRNITGTSPNYAVDKGLSGVTVTVYDAAGVTRGTAVTGATGTYSLTATGIGPYRVEFTNLPTGLKPSTVGGNNSSSVRFVPDGNSANLDFGAIRANEYCQANPDLATSCFSGTVGGPTSEPVLVSFPYESGTTSTTSSANVNDPMGHALMVQQNELGSIWGLAYQRRNKKVFAAAFTKRHAGFRNDNQGTPSNDPTGEIFISDSTGTSGSLFLNLNSLFGSNIAGANPHQIANYETDSTAFDAVGKTGLGDIDISEDEQTLYVSNLRDRKLYAVPLGSGVPTAPTLSSQVKVYDLASLMNPGTGPTGCPMDPSTALGEMNRNLRTGALAVKAGKVYVGLTCTAQSTGLSSDLRTFVYELNPAGVGSAVQVVNVALNYPRGCVSNNGTICAPATWLPWTNNVSALLSYTPWNQKYYPQPWLMDIEFDQNDFMMLGLADRLGHQTGNNNSGANTGTVEGVSAGETLRMRKSGATWTLENNANDGTNPPTGGASNGQGPGGGEFYYQDGYAINSNVHSEISLGGLVVVPGYQDIVVSAFDPAPTNTLPNGQATYRAGGMVWFNNTTGARSRSYQLFGLDAVNTFGKAAGIGDIVAMCDSAPIQVGNRVWNDANGNGVQDPGEAVLANVALEIWADTTNNGIPDTRVGTATTDANGNYLFGGPSDTNMGTYSCGTTSGSVDVRVNASTDDAEQLLSNGNVDLGSGDLDFFNNTGGGTANSAVGVRFNGVNIPQNATITSAYIEFTANDSSVSNGTMSITIQAQTGNALTFANTTNNITNTTTRPRTTQSVAWTPPTWTNSSIQNTSSLTAVVQEVVNGTWASGNSMAFILTGTASSAYREAESFDGNAAEAPRLVVTYTTPTICRNKMQPDTAYEVRVATANFNSGGPLVNFAPTSVDADGTSNGDLRDSDGVVTTGDVVKAQFVTGASGANDHSFDFGFRPIGTGASIYSIGNRIWFDTDNDGIIDPGETGIPGVSVSIFLDADGNGVPDTIGSPISTITSDSNGYYRFDSLQSNNYIVRINPSNFGSGAVLEGYQNTSGINTADAESSGAVSNAENGVNPSTATSVLTNGILSNSITLSPAAEPTSEADVPTSGPYAGQGSLDRFADMTVDFGFYGLSLSGTIWNDRGAGADNNDGELDSGETLLPTFNVRLYNSAGVEIPVGPDGILGTADDAPGGVITGASGTYLFKSLPPGDYRVVLDPQGYASSTPTESDPNSNGDNNDNGFPDNTGLFPSKVISGIVSLTPGDSGSAGNNLVSNANGTTANPTVDFGLLLAATQVEMDKFEAFYNGSGVVIEWSTGGESDNLGFNVYRSNKGGSELLNLAPVAGSALRTIGTLNITGNEYRWVDNSPEPGSMYYLEDIDLNGVTTIHGPIYPAIKYSFEPEVPASSMLTDFLFIEEREQQKEFVSEGEAESILADVTNTDIFKQRKIAAKEGVKISVASNDRYRVSYAELAALGFDLESNPEKWRLYKDGLEVPFAVVPYPVGEKSIEFYGRGFESKFTDRQVYYLFEDGETGRRLQTVGAKNLDGEATATSFETTVVKKDRGVYLSALRNEEYENWFGAPVLSSADANQEIIAIDADQSAPTNALLRVKLQGFTAVSHLVSVSFNGVQLGTVNYSDSENREFEFEIPMSSVLEGANMVKLRSVGGSSDISLVDEISLRYLRQFKIRDGKLRFSLDAGQSVRIGGFDTPGFDIFELDESGNALHKLQFGKERIDETFGFSIRPAGQKRQFAVFDQSYQSYIPERVEINFPSSWNNPKNKADMIILAPMLFSEQADRLAALRKTQGIEARVVFIEDVFDEYNFGKKSERAIRDFLKEAVSNWTKAPEFTVLFGDSSYDMRNYLAQEVRDLIPTRLVDTKTMETSSDSWLADFDDDGIEDISIGRLPAGTIAEAEQMVAKLIRYKSQEARLIRSNLLVADKKFENYNDTLEALLPAGVVPVRLNRSSLTDAGLRQQIFNEINGDSMVVTYTGHGSHNVWASNSVFRSTDPATLTNSKLSFFMMMTCLNGYTLNTSIDSLAETLFKSENGAVAIWASSGSTYAADQIGMSQFVTRNLFDGQTPVGVLTRAAKLTTNDMDARQTWQLIGDPSTVVK